MNDNDIIKVLQHCTTKGISCSKCPAYVSVERSNCKKYFRGAIDLINRQNAEVEKLQNELKITRQYIHENNLEYDLLAYSKRGSE